MKNVVLILVVFANVSVAWGQNNHINTMQSEINRKYWGERQRELNNRSNNTYLGNTSEDHRRRLQELERRQQRELERKRKAEEEKQKAYSLKRKRDGLLLPRYSSYSVENERYGLIKVVKSGRVGLYNEHLEREVVPPKFIDIDAKRGVVGMRFVAVQNNNTGKWAVYDTKIQSLDPITTEKYDIVFNCDGIAAVSIGGKWGAVDATGKEVIPVVYEDIRKVKLGVDMPIPVKLNGKWGFADIPTQRVSPFRYDEVLSYNGGKAKVKIGTLESEIEPKRLFEGARSQRLLSQSALLKYDYVASPEMGSRLPVRARIGNKWGFIDIEGNELTAFQYDDIGQFSIYGERVYAKVTLDGKLGLIDPNLVEVIPTGRYDDISFFKKGTLLVSVNNKKGVINMQGKEIIPVAFEKIESNGDFVVVTKNGNKGLYGIAGNELAAPKYQEIKGASSRRFMVKLHGKWGLMSTTGTELTPVIYDDIKVAKSTGLSRNLVQKGNKWGLVDHAGKEIVPVKYDGLWYASNDELLLFSKLNNKKGLIDAMTGEEIVAPKYDDLGIFTTSDKRKIQFLRIRQNGKIGVANILGKELIPPEYDIVKSNGFLGFDKGPITVSLGKKMGYVDGKGTLVIPIRYDYAYNFMEDGTARVRINKKWFTIDQAGRKLK